MENLKFTFAKLYVNNFACFAGVVLVLIAVANVLFKLAFGGAPTVDNVVCDLIGGVIWGFAMMACIGIACGGDIDNYYYSKIEKNNK